jgi:ABC-type transport system involved in cytochrome c biogenesis permease subunit
MIAHSRAFIAGVPARTKLSALFMAASLLFAAAASPVFAGLDDEPEFTESMGLGGEFTLLPEDVGRPAKGLALEGSDRTIDGFAKMAVLHDGRVKPLETVARHTLIQWSGRDNLKGRSAISVIAQVALAPEMTGDLPLFRIDNPEVAEAIGMTPVKNRLYTYRQIEPGLEKLQKLAAAADTVESEKRNIIENEVLRTFGNVANFLNLTRSMQFAVPSINLAVLLPETRQALNLPEGPTYSFWEMMARAPLIAHMLDGVGKNPAIAPTPVENEIVRVSRAMFLQSQAGGTSLLQIIPTPNEEGAWMSPAEVVAAAEILQRLNGEISSLAKMTEAYRAGDEAAFDEAAAAFNASVAGLAAVEIGSTSLGLEVFKNRIDPLYKATVLFWIAMFTGFLYFLVRRRWIYSATWIFSGAGLFLLTADIIARMIIMRRPPVTSLFETFPFVAAVSIAVAMFLERRSRQGVALLSAGMLGTLLLTIASRYASDGDTKQMLVAVLNSNFWLTTHVITITVGYAACALSGAIAHIRLVRGAWTPNPDAATKASLREIDRMIYGTLAFGLLFSFIGTVLGGIWADQSWGRFWGWDPKENGALLIVLWCAILLHAKHWGVIRETGIAACAIIGAVIVSLAWQGVNLLNVGLHSYGFTSGAALKLFAYIGAEFLFLLAMWGLTVVRKRKSVS